MTRWLLVLALVGCGGGAKSLHLPTFTPAVDQKTLVDETATRRYQLHLEDGVVESRTVWHRRSHRTVIQIEGAMIVRRIVRIEVEESTAFDSAGAPTTTAGPLAGKSYELWTDRDALEAQHADGSPITAEERAALNKAFGTMGKASPLDVFLTGRTWKRDEVVEIPRDVYEAYPLGNEPDVQTATMAWIKQEGPVATFRATLTYTTADGIEVQMTSDTRVDRVSGIEVGNGYRAIKRGTERGIPWVEDVEAVTTYEAE